MPVPAVIKVISSSEELARTRGVIFTRAVPSLPERCHTIGAPGRSLTVDLVVPSDVAAPVKPPSSTTRTKCASRVSSSGSSALFAIGNGLL